MTLNDSRSSRECPTYRPPELATAISRCFKCANGAGNSCSLVLTIKLLSIQASVSLADGRPADAVHVDALKGLRRGVAWQPAED